MGMKFITDCVDVCDDVVQAYNHPVHSRFSGI